MKETLPRQLVQQHGATAVPDYSGCRRMTNDDGVLKQTLMAACNRQQHQLVQCKHHTTMLH